MSAVRKLSGATLALAAATVFAAAGCANTPSASTASGNCAGINACKGQSACKTANSACKGQNACKGNGIVKMSKAECTSAGGNFSDGGSSSGGY